MQKYLQQLVVGLILWASFGCSEALLKSKICMKDLGCFESGGVFQHPLYRTLDLLPQDRDVIKTTFRLYTRSDPEKPYLLSADDREGLKKSPFKAQVWTRFIVHGYLDNEARAPWQKHLKNELLLHSDVNCIIVDWSGGNQGIYPQAASNTRVVGAEIALLMSRLVETVRLDVKKVHIIGHSLGSHIAGYAGERTKGLARITALDPAGPYFEHMPTVVRLDEKDADFVDVIHSEAKTILRLGFGMKQQVGHIDFYPNRGRDQPGCKSINVTMFIEKGIPEALRVHISCSHLRAIDYFMATLNNKECAPVGIGCQNWQNFLEGKCTDCGTDGRNCGIMGIRAYEYYPHKNVQAKPKMYLKTSGHHPYCLFQYVATVKLPRAEAAIDNKGTITITIGGQSKDAVEAVIKGQNLKHGSTYQTLFTSPIDLGEIRSVSFKWKPASLISNLWLKRRIFVSHVEVMPLSIKATATRKFCNRGNKAIESGQTVTFNECQG